jgi:hypothetical protein
MPHVRRCPYSSTVSSVTVRLSLRSGKCQDSSIKCTLFLSPSFPLQYQDLRLYLPLHGVFALCGENKEMGSTSCKRGGEYEGVRSDRLAGIYFWFIRSLSCAFLVTCCLILYWETSPRAWIYQSPQGNGTGAEDYALVKQRETQLTMMS